MRVLVEILHPAHVHFFRNAIVEWRELGHEVLVLSRDKDVANQLLIAYGIPFLSISRLGRTKLGLLGEMVVRDLRMLREALRFQPDVLIGIMGVTIVQVARVLRKPAIVFYDTENAKITNRFVYPLAHSVCTPACYQGKVRGTHIRYPSYHELSYLHPKRFTPDPQVLSRAEIDPSRPFFILRFVSWQASHDLGEQGFSLELKRRFVSTLQDHGRVLISSEAPLPEDLEPLRFSAPPEDMHHFVAFATLLIGESATMASEAAVLGTPALYIADTGRGYTDELSERYALVHNFTLKEADKALRKAQSLLLIPNLREGSQMRREKMLSERIDATEWLMRYVESVAQVQ